jgi:cytochrome c oxidase cbb3-type subunit 3
MNSPAKKRMDRPMTTRRTIARTLLLLPAALAAFPPAAFAAGGGETALVVTGVFTALVAVLLFYVVFILEGNIDPAVEKLRNLLAYVTARKRADERELDEDFDGIRELDNPSPPWFNYLFVGTIIFAGIYMLDYHVLGGSPLSAEEYRREVAEADVLRRVALAAEGSVNEEQLAALTDAEALKAGKEKYDRNCVSCHGAAGQGIIGPNLTDANWVHGGGVRNVYLTIKNGVPAKGMIAWKLVFTPKEMQQIASYVLSLKGTNPPGGKPPEGEVWVEPKAAAAPDSTKAI